MGKEKHKIELRPMMKIVDMVTYLKTKNIKFELITEEEAQKYLRDKGLFKNKC